MLRQGAGLRGILRVTTLLGVSGAMHVMAQPTAPRLSLTEELRLEGNAEDFPAVVNVKVGGRGHLAVFLNTDMQLRIYDPAGRRVAAMGRPGDGPGEFRGRGSGVTLGWVADTVWVYDSQLRRFSHVSLGGRLLRTTPLTSPLEHPAAGIGISGTVRVFMPLALYGDGSMLGTGSVTPASGGPDAGVSALVHADRAGRGRVVMRPPSNPNATAVVGGGGSFDFRVVPFQFSPARALSPDGSRIGYLTTEFAPAGGTFTVTVLRLTGDTIFARAYPFVGISIPASERNRALAELAGDTSPRRGQSAANARQVVAEQARMAADRIPHVYPPVESLTLGSDNTAWVVLRPTREGKPVLVLDARGTPVASLLLPERSQIVDARLTQLVTIQSDADGLPSVVRYRLDPAR